MNSSKVEHNKTIIRHMSPIRNASASSTDLIKGSKDSNPPSCSDLNKTYKKIRQEYAIRAELSMVHSENIPGIYVIPSKENSLLWFGCVFVRAGLYEDAIFRFTLILDENFPDAEQPRVLFHSDTMHPCINPDTGELNLRNGFPTWNRKNQHLWQVLKYIYWCFYFFDESLSHAVNMSALDLYTKDKEKFKSAIGEIVQLSQKRIYDTSMVQDKHYFVFKQLDVHSFELMKRTMLKHALNATKPSTKLSIHKKLNGSTSSSSTFAHTSTKPED